MTHHSTMPFNSNDASKLFVFALLAIPPIIFLIGIIPVLFLLFGIFMLRKSGDFGHIETAARNYRIFCALVFLVLSGITVYFYLEYLGSERDSWEGYYTFNKVLPAAVCSLIPLAYIAIMHGLFLKPMRTNRHNLTEKLCAIRARTGSNNTGEIDIIKGERLRSFSVADELQKWAKLKDDGHITEQEFAEARRKLLERN